jgi:hypothetical protein
MTSEFTEHPMKSLDIQGHILLKCFWGHFDVYPSIRGEQRLLQLRYATLLLKRCLITVWNIQIQMGLDCRNWS